MTAELRFVIDDPLAPTICVVASQADRRPPTAAADAGSARFISRVPGVQGGEPVIAGTRVPVRTIVLSLDDYSGDIQRLADDFALAPEAVDAALAYYDAHRAEIDQIIERHEQATYRT